jgi:shikimate dehydrogenase
MTPVSAATSVAGIIGWPVDRSLSPAIHNAAFAAAGLDWVYVAFPVRPGEGVRAVDAMRAFGVRGLNVTMPHKRDVIAGCDSLTTDAERAGAVNTIVAEGSGLVGANTDGAGFLRFLERDASCDPAGKRVLLLGAGGAARSLAISLADAGAEVVVAARRPEQATEVAALAKNARAAGFATNELSAELEAARIVINATPIGREGDSLPLAAGVITADHLVVDLIYHPETTPLLQIARARGAANFNGVGMLVHQAALSFEAWTGVTAPVEAMRAAAA